MMLELMHKRYDKERYHCVHFAVDVWKAATGNDLSAQFNALLGSVSSLRAVQAAWDGFTEVCDPVDPSMVLMRRGDGLYHLGVFWHGRVLHLREFGPHAAAIGQLRLEYTSMRFFHA